MVAAGGRPRPRDANQVWTMDGVAGMLVGIALARLAGPQMPLLRAAVLAQTADLVTFAVMWEYGQSELNPLGRWSLQSALSLFDGAHGISVVTSGAALMSLKLVLIAYLIQGTPFFGPYRTVVLRFAIVLGAVGAFSNLVAYPTSVVSLIVVATFALVAARWPSRFWDAFGIAVRLVASACFGLAALVAFAYMPGTADRYVCGSGVCSPLFGQLLLALVINLAVVALIGLWLSLRFAGRFVSVRLVVRAT